MSKWEVEAKTTYHVVRKDSFLCDSVAGSFRNEDEALAVRNALNDLDKTRAQAAVRAERETIRALSQDE